MPDSTLARIHESLRRLRLTKLQERVETLLQEASQQDLPYAAFLDRCLAEEVASKTERQVAMHTVPWRPTTSASSRRLTGRRSRSSPPAGSSTRPRT